MEKNIFTLDNRVKKVNISALMDIYSSPVIFTDPLLTEYSLHDATVVG